MSRQYRAIWQDQRFDLIDSGFSTCQAWLDSKGLDVVLPQRGVAEAGAHEISVDRVASDSDPHVEALRIRLTEVRNIGGSENRWTTTSHWMKDGTHGWVWIDLEWISDDISTPRYVYAPGLARRQLVKRELDTPTDNLGPEPVRVESDVDINDLLERLYQPGRSVPLVLYSFDDQISANEYDQRVSWVARRLTGCADVRMLTARTQNRFHEQADLVNMSVFDGAVRIYLPAIDSYDPQPWKHRYILRRYLPSDPRLASNRIVDQVLRRTIAQKPPQVYLDTIRPLFLAQNRDWEVYAMELDDENIRLREEIERLQTEKVDIQDEKDLMMEEAMEGERIANKLMYRINVLRQELRIVGVSPEVIEQKVREVPLPVSCSEAIVQARELERVVIHDDAPREIGRLDSDEDSSLWGKRMYRFLLALEAYAKAKSEDFSGNFMTWCVDSGSDHSIPSKFVALGESETVRKNRSLMQHRIFPVAPSVDSAGKMEMTAHLKVVAGGGMHIPRIYFHDDTMNSGQIHVGFIGPHDLVPNPSRN